MWTSFGDYTAGQARAVARGFCLRCQRKETAVLAFGRAHLADWPAVDARGADGGEESPIKPGVPRLQRLVARVVFCFGVVGGQDGWHGGNDTQGGAAK